MQQQLELFPTPPAPLPVVTGGPDWLVLDHGSVALLRPLTTAAVEHAFEYFPDDCPMLGDAFGIERRYAVTIVRDLIEAHGFDVDVA